MAVIKINTPTPIIVRVQGIAGGPEGPAGATGAPGATGATGATGASGNTASKVIYSAHKTAEIADADKIVDLSGASTSVTYSIDPSTFLNRRWTIGCVNNSNLVQIYASSGLILDAGGDTPTLELSYRQYVMIHSDGTNLRIVGGT